MADHSEVAYTTADGNDYPAHEQTYEGFIMLVKYGTAAVIFIVALMAYFPDLIRRSRIAAAGGGREFARSPVAKPVSNLAEITLVCLRARFRAAGGPMKIAVAKEIDPSEPRVAASPDTVKKFKALGVDIAVEPGAGIKSGLPDSEFTAAGATVSADALKDADIIIKVKRPEAIELAQYKRGALVIAIMDPYGNEAALKTIADAGVSAFAMELMPRITRAQVMDVLSSQANLAGYRAVIEARRSLWPRLPDDDDRGRHHSGRKSVRDGRRRRRPAGDRDRAAARRRRHRDRRAARHQGAGRKSRRKIPRGRGRGIQERADRRRLRQGNVERVSGQAGRADRRASSRSRTSSSPPR